MVVEAILEHVADAKDLGRLDCVARVFHNGMIETVLRRLAQRATGRAVPLGDPPRNVVAPRTWTQRLLREMLRWWWKLPGGATIILPRKLKLRKLQKLKMEPACETENKCETAKTETNLTRGWARSLLV